MMRIMIGVTIGLLLLLIVLVVVVLLRQTSTKALKAALPVFFKKKDEGRASIEKRPLPATKVPPENRNSTVLRIADYQVIHPPPYVQAHLSPPLLDNIPHTNSECNSNKAHITAMLMTQRTERGCNLATLPKEQHYNHSECCKNPCKTDFLVPLSFILS